MRKDLTTLMICALAYSIMAFGYIQATYTTKDSFEIVLKELHYIRNAIDDLREK